MNEVINLKKKRFLSKKKSLFFSKTQEKKNLPQRRVFCFINQWLIFQQTKVQQKKACFLQALVMPPSGALSTTRLCFVISNKQGTLKWPLDSVKLYRLCCPIVANKYVDTTHISHSVKSKPITQRHCYFEEAL